MPGVVIRFPFKRKRRLTMMRHAHTTVKCVEVHVYGKCHFRTGNVWPTWGVSCKRIFHTHKAHSQLLSLSSPRIIETISQMNCKIKGIFSPLVRCHLRWIHLLKRCNHKLKANLTLTNHRTRAHTKRKREKKVSAGENCDKYWWVISLVWRPVARVATVSAA